jgi:N-dimethylarginine dimethylaminohydrolase
MPVPFRRHLLDRGIALVEVPDQELETLGCNLLAVAPRACIMVEGNPQTRRRIETTGCTVRAIEGSEICVKGGGGPTCLTRPILRESAGP